MTGRAAQKEQEPTRRRAGTPGAIATTETTRQRLGEGLPAQ